MSKTLSSLNKKQKEAVLYDKGPLAIIAGAGSGKTKTITHKIAHLIEDKGVSPWKILAVTFTNKAANEMRERISALVGTDGELTKVLTYHSLCARILREDIGALGMNKKFHIIDTVDQKQILRRAYRKFDLNYRSIPFKTVIEYISHNKNSHNSYEELLKKASKDVDKVLAKIYAFYIEQTAKSNSLDFDDLLLFVDRLFKENKEIAKKWNDKFDFVLVDEFQDTSIVQYDIIRAIAKGKNIVVVGDPDQTIYTWRHADASLIMDFKKKFKGAKIILLEQNYRSTSKILDAANKLIMHNKNRIKKQLFSTKEEGEDIIYYHGFSEDNEARWVADEIENLQKQKNQLKDIVILYRSNYLTGPLEKALINKNINYLIYGGVKFYQREEIKDVISYMRLIHGEDNIALRRMINVPARKIGKTSQEKLFSFLETKGEDMFEQMIINFNSLPLKGGAHIELKNFIELIRKYRVALNTNPIHIVVQKFLIEIKYLEKWSSVEDSSRRENVRELIKSISTWEKNHPDGEFTDYLEDISLYIDNESSSKSKNVNCVSLMTIHTAKGLEFKNVFIYGASEEVFPSKRSIAEGGKDALEEERRLAYVAATRAMKKLFITSSKGFGIDYKSHKVPSRFISELGIKVEKGSKHFISPKSFEQNYVPNNDFDDGDKIIHEKFGEGIVASVQGDIVHIAFKAPHGVKIMMKNHKSLRKLIL